MKQLFDSGDWKVGRDIQTDGEYEGELKDGERHGLGKIIKENGNIVFADYKDGKKNGLAFLNVSDVVQIKHL